MSRHHALCGVSIAAIHLGWIAAVHPVHGQSAEPAALPPVNVEAPRESRAKPPTPKRAGSLAGPRRAPQQAGPPEQRRPIVVINTAGAGAGGLYRAPNGQTATTIDRSRFDNRPAFSVADILRESPGISVKQGNGPRDLGISIRGSNARNGFGIRNMVIFDDGFPVTQPDGLSRSDLIDPHAYGAVDVIRGPSSALYGNYATGGAINFRTRLGREIDGFEYGVDGGSFNGQIDEVAIFNNRALTAAEIASLYNAAVTVPENVLVKARATVTAGLAKDVDAVNQYAATM